MTVDSTTADSDPLAALLAARRGTAFFSRAVQDLDDSNLDDPSALDGWVRRDIVAYVGSQARRMAELVAIARTGDEMPQWNPLSRCDIIYAATLPAVALRNLHAHAAVHLNVEWRELDTATWNRTVATPQGIVTLDELTWNRAHTVWFGAVGLGAADDGTVPKEVWARPVSGPHLFRRD